MRTELFAPEAADALYLVDLSGYVLRAYHAIGPLSSPSGEPTNAVFGTVNMLERLLREQRPALLAVAMDSGRKTFRTELYADYKANRPPAPADLKVQMDRCRQIVQALSIPVFQQQGVEADDLIACVVDRALANGLKVVIVTADKDLMQLVTDQVLLWDTMRNKVIGPQEVVERFGVEPRQIRDLLALVGDASDNVPGVASIGPKTARDLLLKFGTLDNLYRNLARVEKSKLRETLASQQERARLSQRLVTLRRDLDIPFDESALRVGGRDLTALEHLYSELGFVRQLHAVRQDLAAQNSPATSSANVEAAQAELQVDRITNTRELAAVAQRVHSSPKVAIAVLAGQPSAMAGPPVGLALAFPSGPACYIPISHRHLASGHQCSLQALGDVLSPWLSSPEAPKLGHDLKEAWVLLRRAGLALEGMAFDTRLASYLLTPDSSHQLSAVAERELGHEVPERDDVTRPARGRRVTLDELDPAIAADLGARRATAILALEPLLARRLSDARLDGLLADLELPLTPVLARMQAHGVLVDVDHLRQLSRTSARDLEHLEHRAHQLVGRAFNVHAPRQLETLLFDDLGLKPLKRTKTARSTDAATLEALASQHELPRVILEIRQLAKLKGTYIDALPTMVNPQTGRVHTTWEQAVAATGRLSSTEPNLQNIPVRTQLGRSIRVAFVAPPNHQLVSADYSQIELRVLAHLSQDPVLLEAFRSGQDVHTRTAMEVFEVASDDVTAEMRRRAKAVNFGVIYGQGEVGLAKSLGIPKSDAKRFIDAYFRRHAGVRRFMEETLERARTAGSVRSLFGRHRLVPDIGSGNRPRRLAAERVAMNMPIQATAADLLKRAMLGCAEPISPGARLVLTVHDELVFEVPTAEVPRATERIRETMQGAGHLDVPLEVDIGTGENWNQAH